MSSTGEIGADGLTVELAGETMQCLPEHALLWAAQRTLFVADVHLGKAASFRAAGVPVPSGHSGHDLARLSSLIVRHAVQRLVILGDLVHTRTSYTEALDRKFRDFRAQHEAVGMVLIRGNHDRHAGEAPQLWRLDTVAEPFMHGPFACCHEPGSHAGKGFELAGHIHPALRVQTAREGVTLPCFWLHAEGVVLPAFGSMTGRWMVQLKPGERAVVVAGRQLHAVAHRSNAG